MSFNVAFESEWHLAPLDRMEYTKGHTFRFARGKLTGLWHGSQLASATIHTISINPVVSAVPITNHNIPNWTFRF